MKTEKINLENIKPYEKNVKLHSNEQIEKLAKSISKYGFVQPIVVDRDNVIVIGHGRYYALLSLGWKECDCIRTQLSDKECNGLRIADNKLVSLDYDDDLLRQFMLQSDEEFKSLLDFEDAFDDKSEIVEIMNKTYNKKIYFVSFDADVDTTQFEEQVEAYNGRVAFKYV